MTDTQKPEGLGLKQSHFSAFEHLANSLSGTAERLDCYGGFEDDVDLVESAEGAIRGAIKTEKRLLAELQSARQNTELLREALSNVRNDIARMAGNVIWREGQPETAFDYITSIIGDDMTWDEWEANNADNS